MENRKRGRKRKEEGAKGRVGGKGEGVEKRGGKARGIRKGC